MTDSRKNLAQISFPPGRLHQTVQPHGRNHDNHDGYQAVFRPEQGGRYSHVDRHLEPRYSHEQPDPQGDSSCPVRTHPHGSDQHKEHRYREQSHDGAQPQQPSDRGDIGHEHDLLLRPGLPYQSPPDTLNLRVGFSNVNLPGQGFPGGPSRFDFQGNGTELSTTWDWRCARLIAEITAL